MGKSIIPFFFENPFLNNIFIEAARMLAARTLASKQNKGFTDRLERLYQLALSRSPDPEETKLLNGLYQTNFDSFKKNPESATEFLSIGQAKVTTTVDAATLAAWTSIARAVLNTNEFITRN